MTLGEVVAKVTREMDPPIVLADNLQPLRQAFADTVDAILVDLQSKGFDLDDCVLHRVAGIRINDVSVDVTIETLADRDSVVKLLFDKGLCSACGIGGDGGWVVEAVTVSAVRTPDYPPFTFPIG